MKEIVMKLGIILPSVISMSLVFVTSCANDIVVNPLATALHEQCVAELDSGKLEEAEESCSRALNTRKKDLGDEHAETIQTLEKLATAYRALGKSAEAERLSRQALAVKERKLASNDAGIASTINNLAGSVEDLGRYSEAEKLFNQAAKISEQSNGADDPRTATILNNLAVLFEKQGRFDEAEKLHRRILAIRKERLGTEHPRYASSLNNLAVVLYRLGRFEESVSLLETAIPVEEKSRGPDHPLLGFPLNNLGATLEANAEFSAAERIYQRALLIRRNGYGERHFLVAQTLRNMASLYLEQGDRDRAEKYLNEALSISEETLGALHPETRKVLEIFAILHVAQGDFLAARTTMQQVVEIDRRRLGRQGRQHLTPAELANLRSNAGRLLELIAEPTESSAGLSSEDALDAIQLASSDAVGAAANEAVALFADQSGELADLIRELQAQEQEVDTTNTRILKLAGQSNEQGDNNALALVREKNDKARHAVERLVDEIVDRFPAFGDLAIGAPISMAQLQPQLAADEALINFAVLESDHWPGRPASIFAVLITDNIAKFEKIDLSINELREKVSELRNQLDPRVSNHAVRFNTIAAHQLHEALLGPFSSELDSIRHLYVVVDGPLEALPFSVLVAERPLPDASYSDVAWLVRKMSVTTLPSAASLRGLREFTDASTGSATFLGVGDPLLADHPAESQSPPLTSLFDERGLAEVAAIMEQVPSLPETADELSAIADMLEADENSLLLREEATESTLKAMNLSHFRILSFATHALVAGEINGVLEPALVLTPPDEPNILDDGLLTASEIGRFELDADLAILSACNTAASDGSLGAPGLSGLARAFIFAGTRALLVSHWAVLSDAAVMLTTGMIEAELSEPGIGHAEALRRSMLKMLDNPTSAAFAHPGAWAPFVIVGDGRAYLRM